MNDGHDKQQHAKTRMELARTVFLALLSPLIPIVIALALSYITAQAMISRARVARIRASPTTLMQKSHHSTTSEGDNILVDIIDDAVNIPTESEPAEKTTTATKGSAHVYNVKASRRLADHMKPMDMTPMQLEVSRRLNQLEWHRVLVYIRGLNAHASIICRARFFANEGGRAAVQQFVDSLSL
ncbi:hypothetical protein BX666DRAFT_1458999 [Dichotomocladium elegans]|nr:hypothetical protein BX666DRAFT_1458999 [Dichotomocladium elegans]